MTCSDRVGGGGRGAEEAATRWGLAAGRRALEMRMEDGKEEKKYEKRECKQETEHVDQ